MAAPNTQHSLRRLVLLIVMLVVVGLTFSAAIVIAFLFSRRDFPTLEEARSNYLKKESSQARGPFFQEVAMYIDHETDKGRVFSIDDSSGT